MTTAVIVRPAGHHVKVTTNEKGIGEQVHKIAPGEPERVFYVHSDKSLAVAEYDPATDADHDSAPA